MAETERRRSRRATTVGRLRVTQWFGLTAAVLGVATLISLVAGTIAIVRLSDARDLVINQLDPAAAAALRLSNALVNEETGVRGYALTAQRQFLSPYVTGRSTEVRATRDLRELLGGTGNADVFADLVEVQRRLDAWQSEYAIPTIDRVRERGPEAVSRAGTERGRRLFNDVRAALRRQELDIAAAREDGRRRLDSAADFLAGAFIAIAALLLLAGIGVIVALRRTVARPVVDLGRGVRRVAQGDFEHRLQSGGPRDIVELAADVDSMRRRILSELSALQAAHARLDRQARDLERSNAELEQFAYVASHDLQEPLRKVASFCQLLEQRYRGQLDERADQYIDFAVDGAKRMQQLINDLLAFSRVGRLVGDWEVVALDDALERARLNLVAAIEETGATVIAPPLPSVRGEATLLALVFQNLIANAIKFRRPDTAPAISLAVAREDGQWLFTCVDNGIGIEPDYAERVFVIFQRLHTKAEYPGTGIGLAMCRKIVEYHGGRIWLDTDGDDSTGAVFRFTLPILEEPPA
jgi:signal transduction histidine kinase